ncbi:hypothetical protein [Bacillus sp. AFS096315]|uniref:hypothetical protein n=1 Tax=Bacillus sp. AFS096315 TaxID=2033517 RepID=UPI000BEBC5C5|nr:hypothetical protein [Bacillus sp. AFS096315]PEC46361.1 hypothetical protein CON00_23865 [Bacillus sp. AFS096315]
MGYLEADTRSKLIDPKISAVGWNEAQIQREYKVTDGRITFDGKKGVRGTPSYADYLLRYKNAVQLTVIEAKKEEFKSSMEVINLLNDDEETLSPAELILELRI